MRRIRVFGLVFATVAGGTLAACNLLLGLDGYTGGTGGTSTASGMGGSGGGGMDGGHDGDAAHDSDVDGDSSVESTGGKAMWAHGFEGATVGAIAAGPNHTVFVTGGAADSAVFMCLSTSDAGLADAGPGTGFLVQLNATGECIWGYFFGPMAQGTGVAVDPSSGNVALTGTFTGPLMIMPGPPMMPGMMDSFVTVLQQSSGLQPLWAAQITDDTMGGGMVGNQTTTGVVLNSSNIAVSGSYTGSLGVIDGAGAQHHLTNKADTGDGFAMWFDPTTGKTPIDVTVTSPMPPSGTTHSASAVTLDTSGNVAFTGTTLNPTVFAGQDPDMTTNSGSIFLASYQSGSTWIFDTVFTGDKLQSGTGVAFDSANDVLVAGNFGGSLGVVDASYSTNGTSAIVARYDNTGLFQSALYLGGDATVDSTATVAGIAPWPVPGAIGSTTPVSVALAGSLSGKASFFVTGTNPLTSTPASPSGTNSNVLVAKVDFALSNVLWAKTYGDGTAVQKAVAVAVDPLDASVFVAGQFGGTVDFGGTDGVLTTGSASTLFVTRLTP